MGCAVYRTDIGTLAHRQISKLLKIKNMNKIDAKHVNFFYGDFKH